MKPSLMHRIAYLLAEYWIDVWCPHRYVGLFEYGDRVIRVTVEYAEKGETVTFTEGITYSAN